MSSGHPIRHNRAFPAVLMSAFLLACIIGLLLGLTQGSAPITLSDLFAVTSPDLDPAKAHIIKEIRTPRVVLALLVGANLAVSGTILQGVMLNPLADPSIIGISSGAGLFAIIILMVFPEHQAWVPPLAFIGAMGAATLIYILAWHEGINTYRIILAGVAVAALFNAGISATMVFFSDRIHGALMFMNGSLSMRGWPEVTMILPFTVIGLTAAVLMRRQLRLLTLGDDVASGMGLNVERARIILTAIAALLAASAVSAVGLLGFVGLIVPHTVRLLAGPHTYLQIPGSILAGAALVVICDTLARTVMSPTEIPVGIVMAIVGVPFFLFLLRR